MLWSCKVDVPLQYILFFQPSKILSIPSIFSFLCDHRIARTSLHPEWVHLQIFHGNAQQRIYTAFLSRNSVIHSAVPPNYAPSLQSIDQYTTQLNKSPSKHAWDFCAYFCGSSSVAQRMLPVDVSSPSCIDIHWRAARQPAPRLIISEKTSTPITV